jgi:two-component system CheB/CheR fusion protein
LQKIFKAFEQGESSITRRFGGLGLGLAISRAMMVAHGGTLTAQSAGEGQGSTFIASLTTVPAPETDLPVKAPNPTTSTSKTNGRRILIVDDHLDTCTGMQLLLTRRGYTVRMAHDVASAIATAQAEKFDLLISDLGLPDGTGYDIMEAVRPSGLRGVALSGFGMEDDLAKSRAVGFSEHLIKPVNIESLDALLVKFFSPGGPDSV